MYTFKDKGDRSITLRPEGTAAVVRSYIENKMQGIPNRLLNYIIMGQCSDMNVNKKDDTVNSPLGVEAIGAKIRAWMLKF